LKILWLISNGRKVELEAKTKAWGGTWKPAVLRKCCEREWLTMLRHTTAEKFVQSIQIAIRGDVSSKEAWRASTRKSENYGLWTHLKPRTEIRAGDAGREASRFGDGQKSEESFRGDMEYFMGVESLKQMRKKNPEKDTVLNTLSAIKRISKRRKHWVR